MPFVLDRLDRLAIRAGKSNWGLRQPRTLVLAFVALHSIFLLALLPSMLAGRTMGDLPLYRIWAELGLNHGVWQGISVEWVYPIGALLPITLAALGGPLLYGLLWFLMTVTLNGVAISALTSNLRRRAGYQAAWAWLLFSFLLSPVGLLRLEGLTAPLVITGLVFLASRPVLAGALLSVATWIKVWPAAVLLAVVAASRRRITVFVTGTIVTVIVAAMVWILGGLKFISGFVAMQSDRALQLEAPVTTPWVWLAAIGHQHTTIYENFVISTREVTGPGTSVVASLMTPLMLVGVLGVLVLILLALRRTTDAPGLLLLGALALVATFVVFNKVGSPQYMLWIAPIVTVGVAHDWRQWRTPAYLMAIIALLTTLVFPLFYLPLIRGDAAAVALLTGRNALLIVLFLWTVRVLWNMARAPLGVQARRRVRISQMLNVVRRRPSARVVLRSGGARR